MRKKLSHKIKYSEKDYVKKNYMKDGKAVIPIKIKKEHLVPVLFCIFVHSVPVPFCSFYFNSIIAVPNPYPSFSTLKE